MHWVSNWAFVCWFQLACYWPKDTKYWWWQKDIENEFWSLVLCQFNFASEKKPQILWLWNHSQVNWLLILNCQQIHEMAVLVLYDILCHSLLWNSCSTRRSKLSLITEDLHITINCAFDNQNYLNVCPRLWIHQRLEHHRYLIDSYLSIIALNFIHWKRRAQIIYRRTIRQNHINHSNVFEGNPLHICLLRVRILRQDGDVMLERPQALHSHLHMLY